MRYLLAGLALAAFAGAAPAQGVNTLVTGLNNIDDAVNALISGRSTPGGGLTSAGVALLNGNVTQTFNKGNHALQGFATELTHGTPAAALADVYVRGTNAVYDALLPLYRALDGPASTLTNALSPVTDPLANAIQATSIELELEFEQSALPGLSSQTSSGTGIPLGALQ